MPTVAGSESVFPPRLSGRRRREERTADLIPWGNEEPAFKLANYDKPISHNVYSDSLRPVGSYEGGQSPYGIYDMAGSVSGELFSR